jgi:hypothetical protein
MKSHPLGSAETARQRLDWLSTNQPLRGRWVPRGVAIRRERQGGKGGPLVLSAKLMFRWRYA